MTLFIVRHATAGTRNNADPRDHNRPLDDHGIQQAAALVDVLGAEPIEAVLSSRALRCRQTVGPLAAHLGLDVIDRPALFEGATGAASMALVRALTGQNVVLCSHGDVIPDILRRLEVGGTRLDGRGCAKGSVWRLDNSTERIEAGHYLGPMLAAA